MGRVALTLILLLAAVPAATASRTATGAVEECRWPAQSARADRVARPGEVDLNVSFVGEMSPAGPRARWRLSARNRTKKALALVFPTSQYANVVVRKGGAVVYSWDRRRAVFPAFHARTLRPRENYVCELAPDRIDLEPGRYELIAYLTTYRLRVFTRRSLLVSG
jgi:hypothetical protein